MLNICIFLKTVIKLCYMNWHLVYAMKIKCKTFVIPLKKLKMSLPLFVPFCENGPYTTASVLRYLINCRDGINDIDYFSYMMI